MWILFALRFFILQELKLFMEEKSGSFLESLIFPLIAVALMWLVAIIQSLFDINLSWLGVLPRSFDGVLGIVTSPLVHGGFYHLISNSVPFLISGYIMVSVFKPVAFRAFGLIYFLTGLLVWSFADFDQATKAYHIGASGVVYGMVSFIFWSGVFVKNRLSIVLSLVMILIFSGMINGLSPLQEGISWESHLMGSVVGMLVAFLFRVPIKASHQKEEWKEYETTPDAEKEFFLPRDVFEKTKYEQIQQPK